MKLTLEIVMMHGALLSCVYAQTASLSGRVIDPSGSAVERAIVVVTARDGQDRRSVLSQNTGEYRVDQLTPGEYLIEARASGFGSARVGTVRLEAGEKKTFDLPLGLQHVLTQVQVTAAGAAQSTEEASKAMDVIDSDEIARRDEFSVADALRLTPGLRVAQLGGPGTFTRIQARGLRAFDTSVLIDGFRLRDAAAPQSDATGFLGDLMLVDTDRIEVLRGSGSSLYGTNAAGAVINIVTDQGGGPLHGEVSTEGGGLGMARALAKIAGGAWNDRFRYTAGVAHLNVARGIDGDDRLRNSSAQGWAQFQLTPSATLSGRVFATNGFTQLNDSPYAISATKFVPAPDDPDSRRSSRTASGLVAYTQRLSSWASARVSYNGLITRRDNRDGPAGTRFEPPFSNLTRFDGRIDTLQARTDLQAGRNQMVTAGYEWERESFDNLNRDPATEARARIAQRSNSLYAQDQIRVLANRLQLSISGRIQDYRLSTPAFTGADLYAGLRLERPPRAYTGDGSFAYFAPRTGTKFRAHAGNGYRAPSLYERFGASFFLGSFNPSGDPYLRPERLISVDGGVEQYLADSRLRLRASYFYTRIQEAVVFDSSGAIQPATDPYKRFGGYRNSGGGLARGVELSAEAAPVRSFQVNASYTYTNARERQSTLLDGSLRSIRVFDHMFTMIATQRFGRRLDATFDFLAASDYVFPLFFGGSQPFVFAGPRRGDVAVNYTLPVTDRQRVRFFARVDNVFNQRYYEEGFPTPRRWAVAGLKWLF